ncbi:MAG: aldo/keto reductase [Chloroflexota bacterium]
MQYRELGRTGQKLSVIGCGGMLVVGVGQVEANRLIASAVERGVTYFDVAPAYGNGEAEEKFGPALAPFRDGIFLAGKTRVRDAVGARAELERSLQRLQTDHFDLYQLHALPSVDEVEQVFAPGGAMETLLRARDEGKARYLGFSAHSAEAAVELLRRFPFDSVLIPLNFAAYTTGHFGPQVVDAARKAGAGILALKAMARTSWPDGTTVDQRSWRKCWYEPIADEATASLALRFTLSLPITAAIPPGHAELWEMAYRAAENRGPLSAAEEAQLQALAAATRPLFETTIA